MKSPELCARANQRLGGLVAPHLFDEVALASLEPRPEAVQRKEGIHIGPTPRPCAVAGSGVYILVEGTPRLATAEEVELLEDACGLAEFDRGRAPADVDVMSQWQGVSLEPLDLAAAIAGGVPGSAAPAFLGIKFQRYDTGLNEVEARNLAPVHQRLRPFPAPDCVDHVALDLIAIDKGAAALALEPIVRELLVNAIGHRSYAPRYRDIPILAARYTDALVIWSPGCPPRPVDSAGRLNGRFSRNPRLMTVLTSLGLAHQKGRGLPTVQHGSERVGYAVQLRAGDHFVEARLTVQASRWHKRPDKKRQRPPDGERERRILDLLLEVHEASAAHLSAVLGIPRPTVNAELRELVGEGKLERTCWAPRSRNQAYRLSEEYKRQLQLPTVD